MNPPGKNLTRVSENDQKQSRKPNAPAAAQPETAPLEFSEQDLNFAMHGINAVENDLQRAAGSRAQFRFTPAARAQSMAVLRQVMGNRSIQKRIQRQSPDAGVAPQDAGPTAGTPEIPEALRTFRSGGPYPANAQGTTITPRTGKGGFNARYNPQDMTLTITLNIGMNFVNGMNITGNRVTAVESSMNDSAVQINRMLSRLRGRARQTALDQVREQWQWTGNADPRITQWMASYRNNVTQAWSTAGTGLVFECTRPGWNSQIARVNVVVNTTNITSVAVGAAIPGPQPVHCQANIYKTPDADVFGANVEPGSRTSATDQFLHLGSGQVTARSFLLNQSVQFGSNSDTLSPSARNLLTRWIISFQSAAGTAGSSITITGRSSATGERTEAGRRRNQQLAENRARAVENFLKTTSVEGSTLRNANTRISSVTFPGTTGAGEGREWRRVDISVAGGQGQNIAAHEFGHMIGLGDEYASTPARDAAGNIITDANGDPITRGLISGTGGDVGARTEHDALARQMGLSNGAVFENNDNIMSLGSTVRPQHYVTFFQALREVSNIPDWRVRA